MSKKLIVLRGARALLDDPERWTCGALGRDDGFSRSYCLMGALWSSSGADVGRWLGGATLTVRGGDYSRFKHIVHAASDEIERTLMYRGDPGMSVAQFNDSHATHRKVLEVLDETIARVERDERELEEVDVEEEIEEAREIDEDVEIVREGAVS
jgi:hypothetical protein